MYQTSGTATDARKDDPDWWRGAIIYQVYPRSFQDTNGDGIGDLNGITRRLPHIAELGADAIWISPFFPSPMKDFGYDVTDYCGVDPMFGSLEDFRALVDKAHGLGVRVMIDLVLSHTSDKHPWFVESRSSKDNARADWYVWADARPDGSPPNNWLSIFGGSAWKWDSTRLQYYMHNFLVSQPDLNFHNPEVQDAVLDAARFWLELGVDGFRLDTINFYFHDRSLKDNPPLAPERRGAATAPAVNPYGWQDHLHDKSQPENVAFLKRLRALMDEFPNRAAVGEVGDEQRGMEITAEYTKGNDRIHMCYSFDFLDPQMVTPKRTRDIVERMLKEAPDGWPCWAFSNHDVTRQASRWARPGDPVPWNRMLGALLVSLPGSICVYQGEELGLTNADVAYEDLQDPYGIEFWPEYKGRDGCRTPMVWERDNRGMGGFTTGAKAWLPVAPEHLPLAMAEQQGQEGSVLEYYRAVLHLRKGSEALKRGTTRFLRADADVLVLERTGGGESVLCAFNFSDRPQSVERAGYETVLGDDGDLAPRTAWFGRKTG